MNKHTFMTTLANYSTLTVDQAGQIAVVLEKARIPLNYNNMTLVAALANSRVFSIQEVK